MSDSNRDLKELFYKGQEKVLEQLYRNDRLAEISETIVRLVESTGDDLMCSILEYNTETETLHRLAAPNLPGFFNDAIEGMKVGPGVGACGAAAFIKERVITEDLHTHPFWKRARNLVMKTELRSCWSQPILGYDGNVLGTFAIYRNQPQKPSASEVEVIESAAHLAAIAISHKKAEEKRRQVEVHLQQVRKMEAIENLSEGIAHDFNSFLSIISQNIAEIKSRNEAQKNIGHNLKIINETVSEAKELTSQILEFSSQQNLKPEVVDLNLFIEDTVDILKRDISQVIEILTNNSNKEVLITADREKLQKALLHLCRNAVEAMKGHGKLMISIDEVGSASIPFLEAQNLTNNRYAKITIKDNGLGIKATILDKIFEPFFTTKEVGLSSGMGLSIVHGIVKQNGGTISVKSSGGTGSTFYLYFPVRQQS